MQAVLNFEGYMKDRRGALEDMAVDFGLPMTLANQVLAHLDLAGGFSAHHSHKFGRLTMELKLIPCNFR